MTAFKTAEPHVLRKVHKQDPSAVAFINVLYGLGEKGASAHIEGVPKIEMAPKALYKGPLSF